MIRLSGKELKEHLKADWIGFGFPMCFASYYQ